MSNIILLNGAWRMRQAGTREWTPAAVPGCVHIDLLAAGRILDADSVAFSGVRVMVNMNQTGEAAGVAAWLALDTGGTSDSVDTVKLRKILADGGSIVI